MSITAGTIPVENSFLESSIPPKSPSLFDAFVEDRANDVDFIKYNISSGALVNETDHQGNTPLMCAIRFKLGAGIVSYLLDMNANVNAIDKESTSALMVAIDYNDIQAIELLLSAGADVNVTNCFSFTPLMKAIYNSRCKQVISNLISSGANVNIFNTYGKTPLMMAIENVRGIAPDIIHLLLNSGAEVNVTDIRGRTPLMLVVLNSPSIYVTKSLIAAGADLNISDRDGQTPLTLAISLSKSIGLDVIRTLVSSGAEVNKSDTYGRTPLFRAIVSKNEEIIQILLEAGAKVNVFDPQGRSLLLLATLNSRLSSHKNIPVCKALIDNGAKVTCELHAAIMEGLTDVVEHMLQAGAMPSLQYITNCNMPYILSHKVPKMFIANPISPLTTAILFNNAHLINLFKSIHFYSPFDISLASEGKVELLKHVESYGSENTLRLARRILDQPSSLWTLCFVKVSTDIGLGFDRRERLSKTGLPNLLQRKLMFTSLY